MHMATRLRSAPRRATNISLPTEMVDAAKQFGINISKACEAGLTVEVKRERERRWIEENTPAMEEWNVWLEKNGLPLSDLPPL